MHWREKVDDYCVVAFRTFIWVDERLLPVLSCRMTFSTAAVRVECQQRSATNLGSAAGAGIRQRLLTGCPIA
jgi:hypothetical protein